MPLEAVRPRRWNPGAQAETIACLIEAGADPHQANGRGSTPLMLATRTTGRGGSGSPEAKAQQQEILRLPEHRVTA